MLIVLELKGANLCDISHLHGAFLEIQLILYALLSRALSFSEEVPHPVQGRSRLLTLPAIKPLVL